MKRLLHIKQKIELLKKLDTAYAVFGTKRHQYEFKPCLKRSQLEELEKSEQVLFTDEYKMLLTELGNGGAGCGYGLEALSLKHINPPYLGTDFLLRNCKDPTKIECDMVDSDEISGYVKLFDFGSGIEVCLIVKGKEQGALIEFDCDDRFEKLKDTSIFDMYAYWLDTNISVLERVKQKLYEMPLEEVIESEWKLDNFSILDLIISVIGAKPLTGSSTWNRQKEYIQQVYSLWKENKE